MVRLLRVMHVRLSGSCSCDSAWTVAATKASEFQTGSNCSCQVHSTCNTTYEQLCQQPQQKNFQQAPLVPSESDSSSIKFQQLAQPSFRHTVHHIRHHIIPCISSFKEPSFHDMQEQTQTCCCMRSVRSHQVVSPSRCMHRHLHARARGVSSGPV